MIYRGQGGPTPRSTTFYQSKASNRYHNIGSSRRFVQPVQGFTLVEILVAMVLIAIGFLGMLSMQSFSIQQSYDTHFSNKANYLIRDITDRMRLNSTQVANYVFKTDNAPSAKDCSTNSCSPTDIAQHDKANWASAVKGLPNGKGEISRPVSGVDNMVDILISWAEKDSQLASNLSTATLCSPEKDETERRRCIKLRVHI